MPQAHVRVHLLQPGVFTLEHEKRFIIAMIWLSVNLDFFIGRSPKDRISLLMNPLVFRGDYTSGLAFSIIWITLFPKQYKKMVLRIRIKRW